MKLESQTPNSDLFKKGYDSFGQNPLSFSGQEVNQKAGTPFSDGISSSFISSGDVVSRLNVIDGYLQSDGFVTGSTGWRIDSDGNAEFSSGTFRGALSAATIDIGGADATSFHVDIDGNMWSGNAAFASGPFRVSNAGAVTMTSATLTGGTVNYGKTTFADSTNAGYYISSSGLYFGSASDAAYLKYDISGATMTVGGGTITGATIQTATTGYRIVLDSNNGVQLYNASTQVGYIKADTAASFIMDSDDNIYLTSGGNQMAHFTANSMDLPSDYYITWSGQGRIRSTGGYLKVEGSSGGTYDLRVEGNVYPDSDNAHSCGAEDKRWNHGWFEDANIDDLVVEDSFGGCGSISGCAYIEVNLLNEDSIEQRRVDLKNGEKNVNYTGFELGDVLCWSSHGLKKSEHDCSMCVTAVANKDGNPIVIGAEPIKVVGQVAPNQFLVTSSVEGVARGWDLKNGNPPFGCVIGQSMEFKDDNEVGLIKAMIRKF